MKKPILAIFLSGVLVACSDSSDQASETVSGGSFPALPTSSSERVTLEGQMSFWMYEGDAGCYGTIVRGSREVQLWADADDCGHREYAENAFASVEVTYREDNQYGPGETYTIPRFK